MSRAGRDYTRRLCKGLTPKASVQWPLAEDDPGFDDLEARRLALPTRRLASKTSLHLGALHCDPAGLGGGLDDGESEEEGDRDSAASADED